MTQRKLIEEFRIDLAWMNLIDDQPTPVNWGWPRILLWALKSHGFRAVFYARLMHRAHLRRWRAAVVVLRTLLLRQCGAEIRPSAVIEPGLRLPHPIGIVIGAGVEIASMVSIGQHVTLGANFTRRDSTGRMYPRIGKGCWVCPGAVVAGPVDVGEMAIVGANAVVTRSVPPHTVVVGSPAVVLRERRASEIVTLPDV